MDKFRNKYRISSTRLQNWDYGWDALYFITICTKNRQNYFGQIENGKMNLSNIGVLADVFWYEIENHSKIVELDEFIVMPNHIHGILGINNPENINRPNFDAGQTFGQKRFRNQGKNTLSSILGSYKSAVSKHAHRLGFEFEWQSRFHDHIIRDEDSLQRIRHYIATNVENWNKDKFYNDDEKK